MVLSTPQINRRKTKQKSKTLSLTYSSETSVFHNDYRCPQSILLKRIPDLGLYNSSFLPV